MKRSTSSLPVSRVIVLRVVMIIGIFLIIGRLFDVSVIEHSKAVETAKNQYSIKQILTAKRGKIYMGDLNGGPNFPVALNTDSYTIIADPFLIKDPQAIAQALLTVIDVPKDELIAKLSDPHKRFVVLKKQLTQEQSQQVLALNLKSISVQKVPTRDYPEGSLAAHVIGFVNGEGEGQYGIEGFFNEDLKGYDGSLIGEKDAKRRIIGADKTANPRNGTDILLTLDHNLQFIDETKLREAVKKYEADAGSVVIIDIKTGAILALANEPSFDLNNYNTVTKEEQYRFTNSAVSQTWEPGSVFKTFTLASGMDLGLFDPNTVLDLGCSVKVSGFEIRNAEDKCYSHPTIVQVLAQSINLGTIWAAEKIGNDNFAKYIADFGFGSKTGLELQPEANGKVLDIKQWRDVNRATISFGQGMTVTPVQLANAYAAIANGGKLMHPYIVAKRVEDGNKEIVTKPREIRQVIKPETVSKITMLLEDVVTEGHGKKAAVTGYKIAGKTGTAQVVGSNGKYEENQNIGSFAGFFPSNDPRFAMVVKLDRPKAVEFAESSAAPTFGDIAAWLLHYAKVPPTEPTGN